jgi:outer membrane protein TolC
MSKAVTLAAVLFGTAAAAGLVHGTEQPAADVNAPQTVSEYLRYAALHNAGLKAAFEQWKAALEQIPQAKALPDPTFTYDYFIQQIETRQRVGLMQMFPWFGKIEARTDAAAATAKAAQKRYEARKLQLFFDVKEAFYEYQYLGSAIQVAKENLDLMKHFEEVARAKYLTATATHPDIIRAQIQVVEMEYRLTSLERAREPNVARLNAVLNRPAESPVPWPRQEQTPAVVIDRQTLVSSLKERNPELQAMGFDVEQLQREVDVARKNFYPDIGLGMEWMEMNMGPMSADDDLMLGVQLNVPIWRRSYRAGELQARAAARRAQYERRNTENDLTARLARALYEYEDSSRRVDLYGKTLVPKAVELIGACEAAYMAGTVDFLSLIDAQQTQLQYRLEYERALASRQQRLAELEMLAGTDLSAGTAASKVGEGVSSDAKPAAAGQRE